MGYDLLQSSTAKPLLFKLYLASDHVSAATGKSPTVTLSKNGAAFGASAGAVSELANGWYQVAGNATDTGTLGPLILHATAALCDDADEVFEVVAFNSAVAYSTLAAGAAMTLTSGERDAIAAALLDLANGIETGLTTRQALRLALSALAGKLSGAGTTTETFRNAVADSKNRIVATVDASGNRTAIVTDLT